MRMRMIILCVAALASTTVLMGMSRPADVASRNLSMAADNFEVMRRIVFYNGITDSYMLEIVGLCSLGNNDKPGKLSVTCKVDHDKYKKHFLGLSDNVTFMAEQLDSVDVSTFHYRVMFRPQTILPDVDFEFDTQELLRNRN